MSAAPPLNPPATAPAHDVRLSDDRMALLVTAPDPHADLAGTATRIARDLATLELAVTVDAERLCELLRAACQPGEHLVHHPLLTGEPPVPPRHGEIQWQDDYFAAGFAVDAETDRVDYWERAEKRALLADHLFAVMLLPSEGKPGRTLQGDEVPVPKANTVRLRAGKGVRTEAQDDRVLYYAAVSGRLHEKDGTVTVDEVYQVRGDAGLATGNITHTGTLMIQGDVKENVRIACDGDILVKGLVEPAEIVCGGSLTVSGGIMGDRRHRITVAGTVQARYLNDVILRAEGDVTVTGQIDHSQVETRGKVLVVKGRIAGGEIRAYRGIKVGIAGASGATGTVLMPGADPELDRLLAVRRERMRKLQTARDKLNQALLELLALGRLDPQRERIVEQLRVKLARVETALKNESAAGDREVAASQRGAVREVAVLTKLWSGVTIKIGNSQVTSDRSYDLPRLVALRRDKVRILPMGDDNTPP
jgi:uncharacterized protein